MQIIRAVLREYHAATHTAEVEPVLGPASLVGEIPVLMSCRPDLLTAGRQVAVLTWSDVGGLVLGPYGAVPDDPPNAGDADTVDGIHASATATANKLVALNASSKLPASITGDADTLDGIHAATTPTANKLLAMDANAKFPAHTVAGDLAIEGQAIMKGRRRALYTFGPTGWTSPMRRLDVSWSGTHARPAGVFLISFTGRMATDSQRAELWFFALQRKYSGAGGTYLVIATKLAGSSHITYATITNVAGTFLGRFTWTYNDFISVTVDEMTSGPVGPPTFTVTSP